MRFTILGFCLVLLPKFSHAEHPIVGTVMEIRSGVPDVAVILCDQMSGLPVSSNTFLPFTQQQRMEFPPKLVTALSGRRGGFAFTNVPEGEYRLVAQKWTGPFKGLFEAHGTVIQLFGVANHIRVPSSEAEKIVLQPMGDGVLMLDLQVGNDGTLLVLSTQPMLADPILGFHAPGSNFFAGTIGLNVMPSGRTTVLGVPTGNVHAWFFANDNSPGFAAETYQMTNQFLRAPRIPFVAGWSDGRHEPPARLKELAARLEKQNVNPRALLGIVDNEAAARQREQIPKFHHELGREMRLPNGDSVSVADLVALISYDLLQSAKGRK